MSSIQLKGHINEAGQLIVELPAGAPVGDVIVTVEAIDPDQSWFWSERWQKGIQKSREEIAAGNYKDFSSMDDFIADLMNDDES